MVFKNPRFQILAVFLVTVVMTVGVLLLSATNAATPPPTATALLLPIPMPSATPAPFNPTPINLPTQCDQTGEHYELRVVAGEVNPVSAYATYTSPDGNYEFYKQGDDVFVRDQKSVTRDLGSDAPYGDIVGRVFWSPDSRHVMMTPNPDNHPVIFDAASGTSAVLNDINNPLDFKGWSPSGKVVIFGSGDYRTVSLWSATTGQRIYTTGNQFIDDQWSPDGKWLAYLWMNTDVQPLLQGISIVSADGRIERQRALFTADITNQYGSTPNAILNWSPDSRYVAIHYRLVSDQVYRRVMIMGYDGTTMADANAPVSIGEGIPADFPSGPDVISANAHWSADGQEYRYLRSLNASQFEWVAYTPRGNSSRILAAHLYKPPFYSPSGAQIGLYTRSDGLYTITLTDANAENPITLVENATDMGNPDWSPGEKWVAAVWAEGSDFSRKVHLTWMHPDGSERHDIEANFKDVRELRWMNNDRLAYIAWRGAAGNSIEAVNLLTGERSVLAEKLDTVTNPDYDAQHDRLSFWWKSDETTFGKDAFQADGTRLYHIAAAGDFNRPRGEYWSPDGQVVALKMEASPSNGIMDQQLILAYADGRPPVIARVGLDGLDTPLWSPDSRMVAFAQWVRGDGITPNPAGLAIISAEGKTLWYGDNFPIGTPLEWAACEGK